jgi:multimeric flavodoxin WrbA
VKRLLLVYHSTTGGTRLMVQACAAAAKAEADVHVRLLHAQEAMADDVLTADGYVFATPETLAAISGPLKDFFDRSYYAVIGRIEGRPYVSLICAGSDGTNAARQIARIATGWRLRAIAEPVIVCTKAQTTEAILAAKEISDGELNRCAEIGAAFAAGLAMGIY